MSWISSGSGWRDCTPRPSGPMDPAIKTSREADSRASRAIFTPRLLRRCTSSPRPSGASLKRFAPKVLVSMICAPASTYAWCTRKTASGSVELSSSKQRCAPTDSCNSEPIAPSAMRMESLSSSLKSRIFTIPGPIFENKLRALRLAFLLHERGDGAHEVVLGENFKVCVAHVHEDRRILVAQDIGDAFHRSVARDLRHGLAHHFAHHKFAQVFALQRHGEDLIFVHRADGKILLKYRDLRNVLLLHGFQCVEDRLIWARDN